MSFMFQESRQLRINKIQYTENCGIGRYRCASIRNECCPRNKMVDDAILQDTKLSISMTRKDFNTYLLPLHQALLTELSVKKTMVFGTTTVNDNMSATAILPSNMKIPVRNCG